MLSKGELPMLYKEILPGYDKVPVLLLGDPDPLLPYCMKEYPNPRSNEEVIPNNMLRSGRNPVTWDSDILCPLLYMPVLCVA